ncbi:MAG: Lon protease [Patescibacteria group bacterium]|nr:MAG: Lon protease [Patescibacteria group bacterium]
MMLSKKNKLIKPVVPLRDGIVFPDTENVLIFGREKSLKVIDYLDKESSDEVILLQQKKASIDNPKIKDLYETGVLAKVLKRVKGERGEFSVLVRGLKRVKVVKFISEEPIFLVEAEELEEPKVADDDVEVVSLVKLISNGLKKSINLGKAIDFNFLINILNYTSPLSFSYNVAMILDISAKDRQLLLELNDLKERLKEELELLNKELEILELEQKLSEQTRKRFERGVKESFLREKKRLIEAELGEDSEAEEISNYRRKIKKAKMPPEVEKKALKELDRLSKMSSFNPEASYIRTYLDWLTDLPWSVKSKSSFDIKKAKSILDADHYGLKKIKERIIEYIAVVKLKRQNDKNTKNSKVQKEDKDYNPPTILCFVGPPGVGKTSLGKSIAKALGREFVKISLGGIRDEAEIRGHRRTYVGALPGRIIQGIKDAKTKNPVFMLDEIDKIGQDYRGDPSAALLEALDPEQNHSFSDHYLEVPFDLSDVFFITTANILDTIPSALLDRLEVIHFPGYTEDEKFNIVKSHLLHKQIKAHNLDNYKINVSDKTIQTIIRRYTREAGVRELERQIAALMRKSALKILEDKVNSVTISVRDLHKFLGPYKYSEQIIEDKDNIGISTGLAWTQAGGDILFIEVAVMPGKGNLTLTGQLGDVMKESCQAALSYIRSRWEIFGLEKKFFENLDIHVHVPEGAVPKDGPSAGIAITTAMLSALIKIPVKRDVGMTGEITLRGRVLEIGGVKEKVIAAHRAGIKKIILPKDNKKDLEDIPNHIQKDLKFVFVNHMDEVWKETLSLAKINKTKLPKFLA